MDSPLEMYSKFVLVHQICLPACLPVRNVTAVSSQSFLFTESSRMTAKNNSAVLNRYPQRKTFWRQESTRVLADNVHHLGYVVPNVYVFVYLVYHCILAIVCLDKKIKAKRVGLSRTHDTHTTSCQMIRG